MKSGAGEFPIQLDGVLMASVVGIQPEQRERVENGNNVFKRSYSAYV